MRINCQLDSSHTKGYEYFKMPKSDELKCYFKCDIDGPLHRFPKWEYPNTEKFNQWKSVLDSKTQERGNNYIYNSIRICHKHFEEYFKSSSRRLTKNAVPTLNLIPNIVKCLRRASDGSPVARRVFTYERERDRCSCVRVPWRTRCASRCLTPVERSDWATPIVPVMKKDGFLKPTPPPMPPPLPPKLPPPPDFTKAPIEPSKLKKIEQLKSRPRKRPDWSDMMKEVEQGKKVRHVECNDRSQPIITQSVVVKNKGQFIFESEQPNSHNKLLKVILKGVRLKKVKTNDGSKPNLEGLRKFRRQMTIEEQVQKSMLQANLAASPSGVSIAEAPAGVEEDEIDEMDDIDKVRDDLQSTKQLLAIELRNKEAQERENKRLLTRIQNLKAELARERAIIKQKQHKTVISVTDAYDERLVNNLKMEVEKAKVTAVNLEKQYLQAAEERDTAQTELEEVKRKNAELEKKLEQALSRRVKKRNRNK